MDEQVPKIPEKKKRGRPKVKQGKRVTFYLSYKCIKNLKQMTTLNRNASKLIEDLINKEYSTPPS